MCGYEAMGGITGNADGEAASGWVCVERFERGSVPFFMSDPWCRGERHRWPARARPRAITLGGAGGYIAVLQVACAGTAECLA